jgi:hypothetical protein
MFGCLDALRAWWTKAPELTELHLDAPEPDATLAARMAREATEYASERGLDFSANSLSALDSITDHEPVIAVGAYIGEVMVRSSSRVAWARNERGDPGLATGAWLADPFEWVERRQSAARAVPRGRVCVLASDLR